MTFQVCCCWWWLAAAAKMLNALVGAQHHALTTYHHVINQTKVDLPDMPWVSKTNVSGWRACVSEQQHLPIKRNRSIYTKFPQPPRKSRENEHDQRINFFSSNEPTTLPSQVQSTKDLWAQFQQISYQQEKKQGTKLWTVESSSPAYNSCCT
jgi:hypothetical protein